VELNRLEATATHLKEAIPAAENAIRSILKDLKAKGKWTSELDTVIEEQIKKSDFKLEVRGKLISTLREHGGARAAIERGPANLRLLRDEIDNDVMRVKRLVARSGSGSQIRVSATLAPTVPVLLPKTSLSCMVALVVYAISILIGCKACERWAKEYLIENCCLC
jgi:hypothetical protein